MSKGEFPDKIAHTSAQATAREPKLNHLRSIAVITSLLTLGLSAAHADIYKCTDADGSITYAQIPCVNQETENVNSSGVVIETSEIDCSYADRFALATARRMRVGMSSSELFEFYGGIGDLSKESIGVINYVYSYRTNDAVTVDRIAELTLAKCQALSLGNVSCEVLPTAYTESIGGCAAAENAEETVAAQVTPAEPAPVPQQQTKRRTFSDPIAERTEDCRNYYRDKIDAVDAQMRSGYSSEQGEAFREKLRRLAEQMRACE